MTPATIAAAMEWIAAVSFASSVWLLAENKPLGWWVGLVGTCAYIWVFWVAWLPGEVMIQTYFLFTSLGGIWLWMRGEGQGGPRPVQRASRELMGTTTIVVLVAWVGEP